MHPLNLTGNGQMVASLILGFILGFVLMRSRLACRKTLIDQFSFRDNTFAIVFLISMTIGIPIYYFTSKYGITYLHVEHYSFWPIAVGAVLTGLGIAFCGHIPVTAIASLASGKLYSLWILLGMLAAFPILDICSPIVNDYVLNTSAPIDVNAIAENSIFYDGKDIMLYFVPIVCLIFALFLRLIQPSKKEKN